jgi:hypothetical protein
VPKNPNGGKPVEQPPAAVPGARARPGTVIPADRAAADLPPTEALFDAINRGDIVSARDALTRGADLDGTNMLGLTPTELSVDLGRNDITFLLLSVRGGGGGVRLAPVDADKPAPAAAEKKKPRPVTRVEQTAAPADEAAPKARAPVLFAGNGGAAVPSVGFLGFDHH